MLDSVLDHAAPLAMYAEYFWHKVHIPAGLAGPVPLAHVGKFSQGSNITSDGLAFPFIPLIELQSLGDDQWFRV